MKIIIQLSNAFKGQGFIGLICSSLLLLLLWGCSGVTSRIKEHQSEFDDYPPEIQRQIEKGRISPGFTRTQVYIALGEPYERGEGRWAYRTCAWRKVISLKSDFKYEHEYERAWESHLRRKKEDRDAVFIPPSRFTEEEKCRRYISRYVYFEADRVTRVERPTEMIWTEPGW